MRVKTNVKAGGIGMNHSQRVGQRRKAKAGSKKKTGKRVKGGLKTRPKKSGALTTNHNQTTARCPFVKADGDKDRTSLNHNQTTARVRKVTRKVMRKARPRPYISGNHNQTITRAR